MRAVYPKIVQAVLALQAKGGHAKMEIDTSGEIDVCVDGTWYSSYEHHPHSIYANLLDAITDVEETETSIH